MILCNNKLTLQKENKKISSRPTHFNYQELKQIIFETKYLGMGMPKDDTVENASWFPTMVPEFYFHLESYGRIPTPEEFYNRIIQKYFTRVGESTLKVKAGASVAKEEHVKGRIYRTYPSIVRDFMFYILCCESKRFSYVRYSIKIDVLVGYDLVIKYKGILFGICLFTDTKRAEEFRAKKPERHEKYKEIVEKMTEITIKMSLKNTYRNPSQIILYNESDINAVLKQMAQFIQ